MMCSDNVFTVAQSWEEHERAAAMEDKAKRTIEGRQPTGPPKKIAKR